MGNFYITSLKHQQVGGVTFPPWRADTGPEHRVMCMSQWVMAWNRIHYFPLKSLVREKEVIDSYKFGKLKKEFAC